jgi:hypothetical protein
VRVAGIAIALLTVAALALAHRAGPAKPPAASALVALPAPQLPQGPVTLRVVHAVNPRLPQFSHARVDELLRSGQATAERHFGVRVSFEQRDTVEIGELFRAMPPEAWAERRKSIIAPGDGTAAADALARSAHADLRAEAIPAAEARRFAADASGSQPDGQDLERLARALAARQLEGLARWRALPARDGRPVIGDEPYHEWAAWSALGYGPLPYDVVITNQLIASAELGGNSIHSMLRGGVSIGTTFFGRDARPRAYVVLSTFMFSDELPAVVAARGEGAYPAAEASTLAGAYLAHELGHQLLRLGHPYGNEACVMRPAVMFRFRQWHERLDPAKCPVGSAPPMTRGAISIGYDPRFVREEH